MMPEQQYENLLRALGFDNVAVGKCLMYDGRLLGMYFNARSGDKAVYFTARYKKNIYTFPPEFWNPHQGGGRKRDQNPSVRHFVPIDGLEKQALESFRQFVANV